MNNNFHLDFERPIVELEKKIAELSQQADTGGLEIDQEIVRLNERVEEQRQKIYSNLSSWQKVQISRHPNRPYALDYVERMLSDFRELHGDRYYGDDPSVVGGPARLDGDSIMVVGIQSGRNLDERQRRNFGMPHPEGYRKALRLMKMAAKFNMPILTMVDTSGAYPGVEAEERGQAEAIAQSMKVALNCEAPCISIVIGEGGSGGAIALATSDRVLMLSNSIYSVISPEGCSSILWKSSDYAEMASNSLKITAKDCLDLKIIDEIIEEPIGGAHRNHEIICRDLKKSLLDNLNDLKKIDLASLRTKRNNRYLNYLP